MNFVGAVGAGVPKIGSITVGSGYNVRVFTGLEAADFTVLRAGWEEIRAQADVLAPRILEHLEARLALAERPAGECWDALMALGQQRSGKWLRPAEERLAERLVEAVARHPGEFGAKTLALLEDEDLLDWREIFAVQLAGAMRLRAAVDALIAKFRADDDWLPEEVAAALTRIGDVEAVRKMGAIFAGEEAAVQFSLAECMSSFKHPEAEETCLRLLGHARDGTVRAFLATALTDLCTDRPDALERLRTMAKKGNYDRTIIHLEGPLATLATMTGVALPEQEKWHALAVAEHARIDRDVAAYRGQEESDLRARLMRGEEEEEDDNAASGGRGDEDDDEEDATPGETVRREVPKVGRNDPCPCGSGLKWKKCCGKAA